MSSRSELECSLSKYNRIVDDLGDDPSPELIKALLGRSEALDGLGFKVSAVEDLEDAEECIGALEDAGRDPPAGLCFAAFALLGASYRDDDDDALSFYYRRASEYLPSLPSGDLFSADLCCRCASDCLDLSDTRSARIFLGYPLELRGSADVKARNILMDAYFILGQSHIADGDAGRSADAFAELASLATPMIERGQVEQPDLPLMAYVYLAQAAADSGNARAARIYLDAASALADDRSYADRVPSGVLADVQEQLARLYGLIDDAGEARTRAGYSAAISVNGSLPRDERPIRRTGFK